MTFPYLPEIALKTELAQPPLSYRTASDNIRYFIGNVSFWIETRHVSSQAQNALKPEQLYSTIEIENPWHCRTYHIRYLNLPYCVKSSRGTFTRHSPGPLCAKQTFSASNHQFPTSPIAISWTRYDIWMYKMLKGAIRCRRPEPVLLSARLPLAFLSGAENQRTQMLLAHE